MTSCRWRLFGVIAAGAMGRLSEGLGSVTLIWLVMQRGNGGVGLGMLAAVSATAFVMSSLYGGALVDRFGARSLAAPCILLSAVPVAILALNAQSPTLTMPLILGLVLLAQLPDGATAAATDACLPELAVGAELPLERVNAADDLIDGLAAIAGAPIAGLLITLYGVETSLWVVVAIAMAAAVMCRLAIPRTESPRSTVRLDVLAGVRQIFGQRSLFALVLFASTLVAVFQCLDDVILPVMVNSLRQEADALGYVLGCAGAGGVMGAMVYMILCQRLRTKSTMILTTGMIAGALIAIAVFPLWPVLLVGAFVAGMGAGAVSPLLSTKLQRAAPLGQRGGVLGAASALALALTPITTIASGHAVSSMDSRIVVAALAVPLLITICVTAISRRAGATRIQ